MFHCLTEDGHVHPKIFNNQPFRESALDELEKREGAGTSFVQSIIANKLPLKKVQPSSSIDLRQPQAFFFACFRSEATHAQFCQSGEMQWWKTLHLSPSTPHHPPPPPQYTQIFCSSPVLRSPLLADNTTVSDKQGNSPVWPFFPMMCRWNFCGTLTSSKLIVRIYENKKKKSKCYRAEKRKAKGRNW